MSCRGRVATVVLSVLFAAFAFAGVAQADDPAFKSSPPAYNFGDIVLGEQYSGAYDWVELYPTSAAAVEITSITIEGTDAAAFELSGGGCIGVPLDPVSGCIIYLQFTPGTVGLKQASLEIESNATAGTKLVPISANVIEPAANAPSFGLTSESDALPDPGFDYTTTGMGTADFDGDGLADVVTNNTVNTDPFPYTAEIGVAFGQSNGTLTDPVSYPAGLFSATNLVTGNFDGVNGPDIISLSGGQANVFLNDGDGTFTAADPVPAGAGFSFISPGYFNEDGNLDFTVTDANLMEIFLGDGEGGFTLAGTQETGADGDIAMGATTKIADFRGDGSNDVAITNYAGQVEIYLSDGDGTFTKGPIVRLGGCGCKDAWGISPADLNGDERDDLSVAIFAESQVATLIAQPDGSMLISQITTNPLSPDPNFPDGQDTQPKMVGNGDLNGDGIPELVSADTSGDSITVNSGLASGTGYQFADNISMPGVIDARYISPDQVLVDDFNGDGKGDVIVGSAFHKNVLFTNNGEANPVPLPASLDFGNVATGTTSAIETVDLKNEDGLAPLVVTSVSIGNGDSGDFNIVDDSECLAGPILVGDSCTVGLTFSPSAAGVRAASVSIASNAGPLNVPVTGTGVATPPVLVPKISVQPSNLAFAGRQVGSQSGEKPFVVTSSGTGPLVVGAINRGGTNAGDFPTGSSGCAGKTLQPGATCSVAFSFKPTAAGARSASVSVASNATSGTATVPLSGTATAKPVPAPRVTFRKKPKKKYVIRSKSLNKVKVAFGSNRSGSKFQCRIDRKKFSRCKSPRVFRKIKRGKHTIRVRAIKAGKTGPAKAVKFKVVRKKR
ncbi:MAG: choice-of-anchor D domain-containing protein [Thermoleophilia bacterium]|nr:choice-of-anchor D domain-containing protein [Thermoleophilia bacterium]